MKRMAAITLALALLAAMPPAHASPARAGGAFVYMDPPISRTGLRTLYGLMGSDGGILVPAKYESGWRIDDGSGALFRFQNYAEDGAEPGAFVYDGNGKLVLEGNYEDVRATRHGHLVVTHRMGDGFTEDALTMDGLVLLKNHPYCVLRETAEGYVSTAYQGADTGIIRFYDARLKELSRVKVASVDVYAADGNRALPIPFSPDDKLWGYLSLRGEVAVEPKYMKIYPFETFGRAVVFASGGGCGLIDEAGREVIPPVHEWIEPFGRLFAVHDDGFVYLADADGRQLTRPGGYQSFESPWCAWEPGIVYADYAVGKKADGSYALIRADGSALPLRHRGMVWALTPGKAVFKGDQKLGIDEIAILDIETGGEVSIPGQWPRVSSKGRLIVTDEDDVALYDEDGAELFRAESIDSCAGGELMVFQVTRFGSTRYGLIDRDGNVMLPAEYSLLFQDYGNECFTARRGNKQGYIAPDGRWIYATSTYVRLEDR